MLRLEIPRRPKEPLRILCLGAHSDDIEIGCGGTLLHLLEGLGRPVEIDCVVFSGTPVRAREARASARGLARGARSLRVATKRFRDGFFPSQTTRIKEEFERLKRRPSPDIVFCPWRGDAHQDHRLLSELAGNTFRDHLILEYEIPKYDGDLGSPNLYVPLAEKTARLKVEHLMAAFPSQAGNQWFDREAFWSILRLRGIESNSPSRFAEGFYCRKAALR
jgi:LmbE family N-acetylglucosaminyl deacetylase